MAAVPPMQLFDCMPRSPHNTWKASWPLWKRLKSVPAFVLYPHACVKRCSPSFAKWNELRFCFIHIGIVTRFSPLLGGPRLCITPYQP